MRLKERAAVLFASVALAPWIVACSGEEPARRSAPAADQVSSPSTSAQAVPAGLARAEFKVEGMTCGGCVIGTRAALRKLDGVTEADASYENSSAWAMYNPAKVTPERMMAAIRELGYKPTLIKS